MHEYNYLNKDMYIRLAKYFFGFGSAYAITIYYFIKERNQLNIIILGGYLIMCALLSVPFYKVVSQVFFERVVVTQRDVSFHRNFRTITIPWEKVQYFIRLPSRGFFGELIIYYELGDFKQKLKFESTISGRDELIKFIRSHVGKLRNIRKVYR